MKKIFIDVFTTLLLMCVCESGFAQNSSLNSVHSHSESKYLKMIEPFSDGNTEDYVYSDSYIVACWNAGLQKMEEKYGLVSDEMAGFYIYAGKTLYDNSVPFSETSVFGRTCYENALSIDKQLYGYDSPEVGNDYVNMAFASGRDAGSAEQYVDSALVILRPFYGDQSCEVANAYLALGESYVLSINDVCRVAAQCMMVTGSDYYDERDYEEIISILEKSIKSYRKAYDIYTSLGDEFQFVADVIMNNIDENENELKEYAAILEMVRNQE